MLELSDVTSQILLVTYFLVILFPAVFGLHRYYMLYLYRKTKSQKPKDLPMPAGYLPFVTIQLPIYNERYVINRLLETVCAFDYPQNRFEIQVLDDSTDETVNVIRDLVEQYQKKGFQIAHIHRKNREGYKAGALAEGLKVARGEFVAIFDADFLPPVDFLNKTLPHFLGDEQVGMVQTRWDHINRNYSFLTRAQSILLDGHFVLEHSARSRSGCFFNFNGTAGIWKKTCINDAGGWAGDTLTEDIDLSYRAQMKGWRFIYLEDVLSPAELPVDINALKTQQHRWAKGSIQVAKKLLRQILSGPYPLKIKVEALFHLLANMNYLLVALTAFLMPICLYIRHQGEIHLTLFFDLPLFLLATWSVCVFYFQSQRFTKKGVWESLKNLPASLIVGIGLCINNSKAVIEGLWGETGEFTRTPKLAVVSKQDSWKGKAYRGTYDWVSWIEILLSFQYLITLIYVFYYGLYFSLPFVLLFGMGFFYSAFLSLAQLVLMRWHSRVLSSALAD